MNDLDKDYEKAEAMARRQFRKDVAGFRRNRKRRRLELEDLLQTEREKPQALQDPQKIQRIVKELEDLDG